MTNLKLEKKIIIKLNLENKAKNGNVLRVVVMVAEAKRERARSQVSQCLADMMSAKTEMRRFFFLNDCFFHEISFDRIISALFQLYFLRYFSSPL